MASVDLGNLHVTVRVEDIGLTVQHLRALEKAIGAAPEAFNPDSPYGITGDERDWCERLVGLLAMSLSGRDHIEWLRLRGEVT
jgi:hypothetical protein